MSEPINLLVVDLSHYDVPCDLAKAKKAGIEGVIWKATQGTGYFDNTYLEYRKKAGDAGMLWGAYHFAEGGKPQEQAQWFIEKAQLGEGDLFCLDWEEYSSQMSSGDARSFVETVENELGRMFDCVIYGSSSFLIDQIPKELDSFFAARRLWLAQYGPTPKVPPTWKASGYWLWQYGADGIGPGPWTVDGIPGNPDVNSFPRSVEELRAEWASGQSDQPQPPQPTPPLATVTIYCPATVQIVVKTAAPPAVGG
jgi:lysozyme